MAFLMLLVTHCAFAEEYRPSYTYCHFITDFSVDKVWQSDNSWTQMVKYPGYISWKIMVWHEKSGYDSDMNDCDIWLYDTNIGTSSKIKLCHIDFSDTHKKTCSISNENSNTTYWVHNAYTYKNNGEDEDEMFHWFCTRYSNDIKNLLNSAQGAIGVYLTANYAPGGGDHEDESYGSSLSASDADYIEGRSVPTVSNIMWVADSLTYLRYNLNLPNDGSSTSYQMSVTERGKTTYSTKSVQYDTIFRHHSDYLSNYIAEGVTNEYGFITLDVVYPTTYTYQTSDLPDGMKSGSASSVSTTLNQGPFTVQSPAIAQAENLTITDNQDGSATLRWQVDSTDASHPYVSTSFIVERATDSTFTNSHRLYNISFVAGQKDYLLIDSFTNRMQGNVTFYYRISRQGTSNNDFSVNQQKVINTNYATLETFTSSMDTAAHRVNLDWTSRRPLSTTNSI